MRRILSLIKNNSFSINLRRRGLIYMQASPGAPLSRAAAFSIIFISALTAFFSAGECLAAPMTENTATLEVKLRYMVVNQISAASDFSEDDTRLEGGGGLFTIRRNEGTINDILVFDDEILAAGDGGAEFIPCRSGGGAAPSRENASGRKTSLRGFDNSFKALAANFCFGAELSAAAFDGETFYFGTKGGDLIELNERSVRHIAIISPAGRYSITGLEKFRDALLITTAGGGLYIYIENRIFKISARSHGLSSNDVNRAAAFENDGSVYIALALSNGVAVLKAADLRRNDVQLVHSYKTASSVDAIAYSGGSIYAGGAFGVDRIAMGAGGFERTGVVRDVFVTSIAPVESGDGGPAAKIVYSTYASGVFEFVAGASGPKKLISPSRISPQGPCEGILSLKVRGGDLILRSKKYIFKYSNFVISIVSRTETGFSDRLTAVCEYAGRLYCATFDAGVFLYDGFRAKGFDSVCSRRLSSPRVNALARFGPYLLIGTADGLDVFDGSAGSLVPLKNKMASQRVNCIHVSGDLAFVGTASGISIIKSGLGVENIELDPAVIDRRVYCIYYDPRSDAIYFGTYRGFGEMDRASRRLRAYFTINSAAPDNWITAVAPYDGSSLLVATYDRGAALFDTRERKFTPFGSKNTLPSRMVNAGAVFSHGGHTFIGTYNGGLAVVDMAKNAASRHFNSRNGLASNMVTSFAEYGDYIAAATFGGLALIRKSDVAKAFER